MTQLYEIFDQTQHPADVDDRYHIYNQSNCLNAVYWHYYLDLVEKLKFSRKICTGALLYYVQEN